MIRNPNIIDRLYLAQGDEDTIYIDNDKIPQQTIDGIRFLYKQFKRRKNGVILNDPFSFSRNIQICLFVKAVRPLLHRPILILCQEGCEKDWVDRFDTWTNESLLNEVAIETVRPFINKMVLINTMVNLHLFCAREWSIIIVDGDQVTTPNPILKLPFKACFKIWNTSVDVKNNLDRFEEVYKWLYPRAPFNKNYLISDSKNVADVTEKALLIDTLCEDIVLRRDDGFSFESLHRAYDKTSKKCVTTITVVGPTRPALPFRIVGNTTIQPVRRTTVNPTTVAPTNGDSIIFNNTRRFGDTTITPTKVIPTNVALTNVVPTNVTLTTVASTTIGLKNVAPTNVVPTNVTLTTVASTTIGLKNVAPTNVVPTNVTLTTVAPTTISLKNVAPTNVASTSVASTTISLKNVAPTNVASTSVASTTISLKNVAPTNVASTSVASTTISLKNVAPTNVASTSVASTTISLKNVAPTNVASTSVASTSVASTSVASTSVAPTNVASSTVTASTSSVPTLTITKKNKDATGTKIKRSKTRIIESETANKLFTPASIVLAKLLEESPKTDDNDGTINKTVDFCIENYKRKNGQNNGQHSTESKKFKIENKIEIIDIHDKSDPVPQSLGDKLEEMDTMVYGHDTLISKVSAIEISVKGDNSLADRKEIEPHTILTCKPVGEHNTRIKLFTDNKRSTGTMTETFPGCSDDTERDKKNDRKLLKCKSKLSTAIPELGVTKINLEELNREMSDLATGDKTEQLVKRQKTTDGSETATCYDDIIKKFSEHNKHTSVSCTKVKAEQIANSLKRNNVDVQMKECEEAVSKKFKGSLLDSLF